MLTIGQLAQAAGTTPRAVRHYHALALLPEPERRANGYRAYDTTALLRLARIRRLRQLGLSLPEVRDALAGPDEQELTAVLHELVADLERQEAQLRAQRARLSVLLARERDLTASTVVAELLAQIRSVVPDEDLVAREAERLELVEAVSDPEQFGLLAARYRTMLADPEQVARGVALTRRFEALAGADPDDPEVDAVAQEMVAAARDVLEAAPASTDQQVSQPADELWAAHLSTLPAAQRRCLERAAEVVR